MNLPAGGYSKIACIVVKRGSLVCSTQGCLISEIYNLPFWRCVSNVTYGSIQKTGVISEYYQLEEKIPSNPFGKIKSVVHKLPPLKNKISQNQTIKSPLLQLGLTYLYISF
jgi:hypothetical protein